MLKVQIWSDVVCPWCAVGKARFEQALDRFDHASQVQVTWRSFELDPNAPASRDDDYVSMLAHKYGTSVDQAQQMIQRMTDNGAAEGLDFRFDIAQPGNTFDAHRLIHLGAERGRQHQVKARFLDAYHSEGRAIAEHDTLQELAVEAGLDPVQVKEVLATDAYADAVRADEEQAREYGISGVPFFVIDGRFGINGAQPPEVLLQALKQAWETRDESDGALSDASLAEAQEHPGHDGSVICDEDGCRLG